MLSAGIADANAGALLVVNTTRDFPVAQLRRSEGRARARARRQRPLRANGIDRSFFGVPSSRPALLPGTKIPFEIMCDHPTASAVKVCRTSKEQARLPRGTCVDSSDVLEIPRVPIP